MKISKVRGLLYKSAKALGDVSAVKKGKVVRRTKNRIVGKTINKLMKW